MPWKLSDEARDAMLDALSVLMNGGKLRIYTGPQPARGAAITTEVMLAEFNLPATFSTGASGGTLTASAIASVTAAASGTAAWGRIVKSDGTTFVTDANAGAVASGAIIELSDVNIIQDGDVNVTAFTVTDPNV